MDFKNLFFRPVFLLIYIAVILAVYACDESGTNYTGVVFPSENVSYFQHVGPFFEETCSCHIGNGSAVNKLDLSTRESIDDIKFTPLLIPGDPSNSRLYLVLDYESNEYPKMPLYESPINQNQLNGIATWISEGATTDE